MKEKIMKLIADELGVEFGEVFENIRYSDLKLRIEKDGVYYKDLIGKWNRFVYCDYMDFKKDDIIKKPWIPKNGEECFVIQYDGIFYDEFEIDSISYVSRFILGVIYKTEQEAEAHKEEILDRLDRIMKGELVVKFEEV